MKTSLNASAVHPSLATGAASGAASWLGGALDTEDSARLFQRALNDARLLGAPRPFLPMPAPAPAPSALAASPAPAREAAPEPVREPERPSTPTERAADGRPAAAGERRAERTGRPDRTERAAGDADSASERSGGPDRADRAREGRAARAANNRPNDAPRPARGPRAEAGDSSQAGGDTGAVEGGEPAAGRLRRGSGAAGSEGAADAALAATGAGAAHATDRLLPGVQDSLLGGSGGSGGTGASADPAGAGSGAPFASPPSGPSTALVSANAFAGDAAAGAQGANAAEAAQASAAAALAGADGPAAGRGARRGSDDLGGTGSIDLASLGLRAAGSETAALAHAFAAAALTEGGDSVAGSSLGGVAGLGGGSAAAAASGPGSAGGTGSAFASALAGLTGAAAASGPAAGGGTVREAAIAAPPGSEAFAREIGAQVSVFVRDGVQHARLHLHPQELGPVFVQIQLDGQAAQVQLAAEMQPTRDALEQALPALAGQLSEAGLTLAGGGVFERPPQPDGTGRRDERAGGGTRDGLRAGEPGTEAAAEPGAGSAPHPGARSRGLVDLFA